MIKIDFEVEMVATESLLKQLKPLRIQGSYHNVYGWLKARIVYQNDQIMDYVATILNNFKGRQILKFT